MTTRMRRITLSQWIVIAMVVGIALGSLFPTSERAIHHGWSAADLQLLSNVFLRMIKSLIVPLLFATLVVGIAGLLRRHPRRCRTVAAGGREQALHAQRQRIAVRGDVQVRRARHVVRSFRHRRCDRSNGCERWVEHSHTTRRAGAHAVRRPR